MLCTQRVWKRGWKNAYCCSHSHNSVIHTGQQTEAIWVSMDSLFHKQTVVDTQWNLIRPFKVGNSDNATMWTNLMVIILSEINQTKKGEMFCDSTSLRYPNKSNPKPEEAESDYQGSKTVHVSQNPPSFPWGNWLLMTSPKIIGSHIQSNECRHNFIMYTNLTQTSQQTKGKIVSMVPQLCLKLYLQCLSFAYEI